MKLTKLFFLVILLFAPPLVSSIEGKEKKKAREYNSRHFVFTGDVLAAKKMAPFLEKAYSSFGKILSYRHPRRKPFPIFLAKNKSHFESLKKRGKLHPCQLKYGTLTKANQIIVNLEAPRWMLYSRLFHYLGHQFYSTALESLPPWLEEGLAAYFAGVIVHKKTKEVKVGLMRNGFILHLKKAQKKGELPVLEEFFDVYPSNFYSSEKQSLYRAYSWLLVHYMIEKKPRILKSLFRFIRARRPLYYSQILGGFKSFHRGVKKHLGKLVEDVAHDVYKKALSAYKSKRYYRALRYCSRVLKTNSYHTNARYLRALCHYRRKNYSGAEKDFEFLIDIGLDQAGPHYYCASIHWKKGYRPQAIEDLKRARQLNPGDKRVKRLWEEIQKSRSK